MTIKNVAEFAITAVGWFIDLMIEIVVESIDAIGAMIVAGIKIHLVLEVTQCIN